MKGTVAMQLECPNCGKKATMTETTQDIPNFGEILISTLSCSKCGFKLTDVMSTQRRKPKEFRIQVSNQKDLETKLIKSSSGTVEIPELGVLVQPGAAAQGYITNIEGLLQRIEAATEAIINSEGEDEANERRLARKELRKIKDANKAIFAFEVIVRDAFGNSALVGKKVKSRDLTEEEVSKLTENMESLESKEFT